MPEYVYVASSWSNPIQIAVCAALRSAGIKHYDFKNPTGTNDGFHWSDVMDSYKRGPENQTCDVDEYIKALEHPIAEQGFHRDFDAMQKADCCVLVLPCNRSAHLELGWFCDQGIPTAILLDPDPITNKITPELMYKMVDYLAPSLFELLGWLGVED